MNDVLIYPAIALLRPEPPGPCAAAVARADNERGRGGVRPRRRVDWPLADARHRDHAVTADRSGAAGQALPDEERLHRDDGGQFLPPPRKRPSRAAPTVQTYPGGPARVRHFRELSLDNGGPHLPEARAPERSPKHTCSSGAWARACRPCAWGGRRSSPRPAPVSTAWRTRPSRPGR